MGELDDELLTRLPPLEYGEDDDDDGPRDSYGAELSELSALDGGESEEEPAADLDIGIDLAALDNDAQAEPAPELGLDVGELLTRIEDGEPGDDRIGLPELDMSEGVQEVEFDSMSAGSDEGFGEPLEDLVDEELPGLDADAEGDFEAGNFGNLEIVDDERPASLETPYLVEMIDCGEHVQVASIGMGIAALGAELVFHRAGIAPRHVPLPARATTLATVDDAVLVATVAGNLFRAHPDGHLDPIAAFERDVPRALSSMPYVLRVGASSERIALLLDTGELTASVDGGLSFAKSGFPRMLRALSASGSIASDWDELLFAATGRCIPLPEVVRQSRTAEQMLLADGPGAILVAVPEVGVLFSSDDGGTFRRLAGTQGASALMLDDSTLWVGLAGTAFQDAALLMVDLKVGRASTACELKGTPGETINGIAKAEQDGSLWLASSAGLFTASPKSG